MTSGKLPPEGPNDGPDLGKDPHDASGLDVFEIAGTIKWFDASKGYGFIVPDNGLADVLLHVTCLRNGGHQVAYEVRESIARFSGDRGACRRSGF